MPPTRRAAGLLSLLLMSACREPLPVAPPPPDRPTAPVLVTAAPSSSSVEPPAPPVPPRTAWMAAQTLRPPADVEGVFGASLHLAGDWLAVGVTGIVETAIPHRVVVYRRSADGWEVHHVVNEDAGGILGGHGDLLIAANDVGQPGPPVGVASLADESWSAVPFHGLRGGNQLIGGADLVVGPDAEVRAAWQVQTSFSGESAVEVATRKRGGTWRTAVLRPEGDRAFRGLAMSSEHLVVAASDGLVTFRRADARPGWVRTGLLPSGEDDPDLSFAMALDADTLLVTAWYDEYRQEVWSFEHHGGSWRRRQAWGAERKNRFGLGLALDGDTAIVGQHGAGMWAGAAHAFERRERWEQVQELAPPDLRDDDKFGVATAVSETWAAVSSPGRVHGDRSRGLVTLFERSP